MGVEWTALAPEVWHRIMFTDPSTSPRDVLALSLTCKRMANILLSDSYSRDMAASLRPLSANLKLKAWRPIRFSLLNGRIHPFAVARALLTRLRSSDDDPPQGLVAAVTAALSASAYDDASASERKWCTLLGSVYAAGDSMPHKAWRALGMAVLRSGWRALDAAASDGVLMEIGLIAARTGGKEGEEGVVEIAQRVGWSATRLFRESFLHAACRGGCPGVVDLLLQSEEVDVNADFCGSTPLIVACEYLHLDCVARLLASPKVNVNAATPMGLFPLSIACLRGGLGIVQALLQSELHSDRLLIDRRINGLAAPLFSACSQGFADIIGAFLSHGGVDINMIDENGFSALHVACECNQPSAVSALLESDHINVNICGEYGHTPLHVASRWGCTEIVRTLLGVEGIDVNASNANGATPVFVACHEGHLEILNALLESGGGSDVLLPDLDGKTPLSVAREGGHDDVVHRLEAWLTLTTAHKNFKNA